jgi:hypothetical protein
MFLMIGRAMLLGEVVSNNRFSNRAAWSGAGNIR